ncbi:MAG TPA: DUF1501 domain-containing protein [Planctomycetaceae bacterium]|jgi:hypothetical protein|nr:DUF1501 domain-containing protein [Planctomycetaceae bacterium]
MSNSAANGRRLTRRDLIQVGCSTALGLGLSALIGGRAQAAAAAPRRAKSVLFLFLFGGPSHLDTFDPKPAAPDECRGEFRPIDTSVSGVQICEHLPGMAQRMQHWALVRSMSCSPNYGDHRFAVQGMLAGVDELPPGAGLAASRHDWPSWCAGVEYFRRSRHGLPASVVLPGEMVDPGTGLYPAQNAGLLGAKFDPFQVRSNPADRNYRVDDSLRMPVGLSIKRLASKRDLLAALDQQQCNLETSFKARNYDHDRQEAFRLLTNGRLARALAVEEEPAAVRERYGRTVFGQSMLMARRLIEAGIPIVQANITNHAFWDTHYNNFTSLRQDLLPQFDRAIATLMDDLHASGLLDETLVVMMGEFGRTPKLVRPDGLIPYFKTAGRDHWMDCFFALFAGAGVRGGQVIGRSDAIGAGPITHPYHHSDVAATVYSALGIDPTSEIVDIEGRSHRLNTGTVIEPLYTGREA